MIRLTTKKAEDELFGQSKWWGEPDMPETLCYPEVCVVEDGETYNDPLTFLCQVRCDELAPFDTEKRLPHQGMMWFFAALDYFLGDLDTPSYPGMGEWKAKYFHVLYAQDISTLHTHHLRYPDGTQATLPAEAICFSEGHNEDGHRLLGRPYLEEVSEAMPGFVSLLQVDEDERWNLTFHDCGMLNFLISPDDLRQRHFNHVRCYLHSF